MSKVMNINDNAATSASQRAAIRERLLGGRGLTQLEALGEFGCLRLGARIWELRHREGMRIESERVTLPSGKRVARYRLAAVGEGRPAACVPSASVDAARRARP